MSCRGLSRWRIRIRKTLLLSSLNRIFRAQANHRTMEDTLSPVSLTILPRRLALIALYTSRTLNSEMYFNIYSGTDHWIVGTCYHNRHWIIVYSVIVALPFTSAA